MFAPKRRQPLAQVLSRYTCATVAIDGPSPAAGGSDQVCCKASSAATGFCMLHAICIIALIKLIIFLHLLCDARTFAGRLPNVWAI
jgi:hypothetical protein